jgi:hypothetical protein
MSKKIVADELNPSYTVRVTPNNLVRANDGATYKTFMASAAASACVTVSSAAAWLESVTIGSTPATATEINIYDSSSWLNFGASADSASASGGASYFSPSGANWIANLRIEPSAASAWASNPRTIPFNVYCSSGIVVGLGDNGTDGDIKRVTITYIA